MSAALEGRIAEWRGYIARGRAVDALDADELESHLRESIDELRGAGLDDDEAFLVAAKRLGAIDPISREFARVHSARLWKQLVLAGDDLEPPSATRRDFFTMLGLAIGSAILIRLVHFAALEFPEDWMLWIAPFVYAFLAIPVIVYVAIRHRVPKRSLLAPSTLVAVVTAGLIAVSVRGAADTAPIAGLHAPVALWAAVGLCYLGAAWRNSDRRMDFVRYTGEYAIYLVLIVLGGGVLTGLTSLILAPLLGDNYELLFEIQIWLVTSGGAAALVVAAWLVQAKQSVIENIAPVLTAIFTPLFAVMLTVSAVLYALFGFGRDFDRELLIGFDIVMVVVLALLLYGLSARNPERPSRVMDVLRLVTVVAALALDALVLGSMLARVGEYGLTPNRVAALGLNVVLFVNLSVAAGLGVRSLLRRGGVTAQERWQTSYLPVFVGWALAMVVVLPLVFGFA